MLRDLFRIGTIVNSENPGYGSILTCDFDTEQKKLREQIHSFPDDSIYSQWVEHLAGDMRKEHPFYEHFYMAAEYLKSNPNAGVCVSS